MKNAKDYLNLVEKNGFAIIESVFTLDQTQKMITVIDNATATNANFRKEADLFAIRNLLNEVPELNNYIWTVAFNNFIDSLLGVEYFVVKAIYFNKPAMSNWLVTWHQDTTISVTEKQDIQDFGPWTIKQGLQAVQPTQEYMENIFTARIHLDDCDETNGALKVVAGTHKLGMLKDAGLAAIPKNETICNVKAGGVMIMKPLLLHASSKSTSDRNRRVIHLEFASKPLPGQLQWREYYDRKVSNI